MTKIKKIDVHVHSKFSNRPQAFMLSKFKTGECYTEPKTIYYMCKDRDMDWVTITDHDTINGVLEIAHLENTFLSEEITAYFPKDKTDVHIVALDIAENQHQEIARLRHNIYDLATYLRSAHIPHFVAHPLSSESQPLRPLHVEQLLLLFKYFEGRNGMRDKIGGVSLARLLDGLTPKHLAHWAEHHGLEPVDWDAKKYLVGGSDDHGRLSIASAWTELEVQEDSIAGIRDAFFKGRVAMGGKWGTPEVLSHNIYYVTLQYFAETNCRSAFSALLDDDEAEETDTSETSSIPSRHKAFMETIEEVLEGAPDLNPLDLMDAGHTDRLQKQLGHVGRKILHRYLSRFFQEFIGAVQDIDFDRAFDSIPGLLSGSAVLLPYLFGYRHHVRDRDDAEKLVADMGFGYPADARPRVVIFSDTGYDVNGVTISLRSLVGTMRQQGHDVELVFCDSTPPEQGPQYLEQVDFVHVLKPVGSFGLPGYSEMEMGIPSLIDVMEYLARERVAVVQVSSPGPLGLVAWIAAKLMGIPVVANYHTEVHKFAERIIGDDNVTAIVRSWIGWFYGRADKVIVPSRAAAESLAEINVNPDKIVVLPRGVDAERFSTGKRNLDCWKNVGMNGASKVIYVGRVSKEKGLDTLLGAFDSLLAAGRKEELAIIGDGPYLEELEKKYHHDAIHFLRYRSGEQLAQLYASADVLAFPSENDTFGNAVVEAHASGIPVVVVNRGGPQEQVTNGENGFVINHGDVEAMVKALETLLDNPELRKRMGTLGRKRAKSMTWAHAADAQWRFYLDVWGRGYSPSREMRYLGDNATQQLLN
ncbi:MAG: glycosyltransferase [Proteobacteria bacterium]|nr:glycosyltransferase [Pseudomonadota bacterium]